MEKRTYLIAKGHDYLLLHTVVFMFVFGLTVSFLVIFRLFMFPPPPMFKYLKSRLDWIGQKLHVEFMP